MFSDAWLAGRTLLTDAWLVGRPRTGRTGEFTGVASRLEGSDGAVAWATSLLLVRRGGFGTGSFLLETKPKSLLTFGWRSGVEWTEETLGFLNTTGVAALYTSGSRLVTPIRDRARSTSDCHGG